MKREREKEKRDENNTEIAKENKSKNKNEINRSNRLTIIDGIVTNIINRELRRIIKSPFFAEAFIQNLKAYIKMFSAIFQAKKKNATIIKILPSLSKLVSSSNREFIDTLNKGDTEALSRAEKVLLMQAKITSNIADYYSLCTNVK